MAHDARLKFPTVYRCPGPQWVGLYRPQADPHEPRHGSSAASEPMSIAFDPARLAYEMAIRGLSGTDVARKAVLSPATVSTALAGKPIAEASALLIVKALDATPVVEILVRLVAPIVQPSKDDPPPEPAPGQA